MSRAVSVTNLRLKYPGEPELLFRDFSLTIRTGEKVLLLGPSGCGKSTLLQVLSGLVPNAVEMPMKADEVTTPASWGYVFQDPDTQFCMPFIDEELAFVLENVETPRDRMIPIMKDVLKRVGLPITELHTDIGTLSQGMKQRLAIASVLALEPDVLFLDEPTALLDPEGTRQVWETLKAVASDKTVVIVEHKIDQVADLVDRVVVLNDKGQIIADGAWHVVFESHRAELRSFGIWYPGIWDEYAESGYYKSLRSDANNRHPYTLEGQPPLIEVKELRGYRGKQEKITLPQAEVHAGEWICITGENGAGKSTLLLALMQLIRTTGEYQVLGRTPKSTGELSGDIAFVFQNPEFQFVTDSVEDEAAYTLKLNGMSVSEIQAITAPLLASFELLGLERRHPYQLSLGQKRRLSVAAAIVGGQHIVLLDEPTFGQDAQNTFSLLERLEEMRRRGTSIIMVTHDLEIVKLFSTRVWEVTAGRVTFDGEPEAWFNKRLFSISRSLVQLDEEHPQVEKSGVGGKSG